MKRLFVVLVLSVMMTPVLGFQSSEQSQMERDVEKAGQEVQEAAEQAQRNM